MADNTVTAIIVKVVKELIVLLIYFLNELNIVKAPFLIRYTYTINITHNNSLLNTELNLILQFNIVISYLDFDFLQYYSMIIKV